MSNNSGLGVFLYIYWKATWKWFLGLAAGMSALELGLLLYYINGGYQHLFFRESVGGDKYWPTEYLGALQLIRMRYIIPIIAVAFIILLTLTFYLLNSGKSSKLTMRIPVSLGKQTLYQLIHSLTMVIIVWLIQFLLLIAGFLIYRSKAPAGLNINAQLYMTFMPAGLISVIYPLANIEYLAYLLLEFLILSIFPVYFANMVQKTNALRYIRLSDQALFEFLKALVVTITIAIVSFQMTRNPSSTGRTVVLIFMLLALLIMIRSLFSRRRNYSSNDIVYISVGEE